MSLPELDDAALVALIRQGNQPAFTELVRRYTNLLYRLAFRTLENKFDAEDVVQTVLLNLWCKPDQWDSRQSKLSTWLYSVVLNACRDLLRKQNSLSARLAQALNFTQVEDQTAVSEQARYEKTQAQHQTDEIIVRGIKNLPSRQRDALNLAVFCDLPQQEVAKIMGLSLKAVESLLVRAKRNLAKSIQEQNMSNHTILPHKVR